MISFRSFTKTKISLWCAAMFILAVAAAAATAYSAPAPPPACVVSVGARSFDLAELGGSSSAGGAPALHHVSRAADSRGWTYSFAACGDVAPLPAACAGVAPHSAALQRTVSECFGLGASATRRVAVTATGVTLSFSGGDGGRSSIVTVECADVARPYVVRWGYGSAPGSHTALVQARAGCALECARDTATGAVCGGRRRGTCEVGSTGASSCVCLGRHAGPLCSVVKDDTPKPALPSSSAAAYVGVLFAAFALVVFAFKSFFCNNVTQFVSAKKSPWKIFLICLAGPIFFLLLMSTLNSIPSIAPPVKSVEMLQEVTSPPVFCKTAPEYSNLPPLIFFMSVYIQPDDKRFNMFIWTLRSYAYMHVPWSAAYLFIELDPAHSLRRSEVEEAIAGLFNASCTDVTLVWRRLTFRLDFVPYIAEIAGKDSQFGPNSLVLWFQGDDHPFIDFGTDVFAEGLALLAADSSPFVSLTMSHWPEVVRLSGKLGNAERIGRGFVRFNATMLDAYQVFNGRLLWYLFTELSWEEARTTDFLITQKQIWVRWGEYSNGLLHIYVPLRELCRHASGYRHVSMSQFLFPELNASRIPSSYTRGIDRKTLVSRLLAQHSSMWTEQNSFTIPHEWIRTMLRLNGHEVEDDDPIVLGPLDMP